MDIDTYFTMLIYILMGISFIALVLLFLYMIYHKEEEETTAK
jgi:uncharacterized membrane protein YuzA (DUF378 family)